MNKTKVSVWDVLFNIFFVNVVGGGYAGQSGAIRHGIARALSSSRPRLPRFIENAQDFLHVTHVKLNVRNQVLRKLVKHHNSQNVNQYDYINVSKHFCKKFCKVLFLSIFELK